MARKRKHDGGIYRRPDSAVWWMWYRDRDGRRQLESTGTEDWDGAQQRLRERLQARDENVLSIVRKGEQLAFQDWAEFFLENYSRPPFRAEKTHSANRRAIKALDDHVRNAKVDGPNGGRHRVVFAAPVAKESTHQNSWGSRGGKRVKTFNGAPGVQNP